MDGGCCPISDLYILDFNGLKSGNETKEWSREALLAQVGWVCQERKWSMSEEIWEKDFPVQYTKPREVQCRSLREILARFLKSRFILFEGPTGIGKSAIAVTLARYFRSSCLITHTLDLQGQVEAEYPGQFAVLRGRAHYAGKQEYEQARSAAIHEAHALLNYDNFSLFSQRGILPPRKLLIVDEAHRFEEKLHRFGEVRLLQREFQAEYPDLARLILPERLISLANIRGWLEQTFLPKLRAKAGAHKSAFGLDEWITRLEEFLAQSQKQEFVLAGEPDGCRLVPVSVAELAQKLFAPYEKVLLMSATLLSESLICKTLGIPNGEAGFISVSTTFSPQTRRVILRPIGDFRRHSLGEAMEQLAPAVRRILAEYPDQKGIIHSTNYQITQALAAMDSPRLLIQRDAGDRQHILDQHRTSREPTVLVSPGLTEGLDLADELSRFQVICKVPFPSLGDPLVVRKREVLPDWYEWKAVLALVQAAGRSVRSETDYATTYILDECFLPLAFSPFMPEWFRASLVVDSDLLSACQPNNRPISTPVLH